MARYNPFFQLIIGGCVLLASSDARAQDKKILDDYLLRWVRSYWTCSSSCPQIRAKIQKLIDKGADPNAQSAEHKTALMYAVATGSHNTKENPPLVALLLKNGGDPNIKGPDGKTPLMLVPWFRNNSGDVAAEIVQQFIDHKADVNAVDSMGDTALALMAKYGETKSIQILLAHGAHAPVNAVRKISLMDAVRHHDIESVKALLAQGADIDQKGYMDKTAFLEAVDNGFPDIALLLIDKGADMADHFTGNWKGLPLAAQKGYTNIVKRMVEKGSPVDSRGEAIRDSSATALMLAAEAGNLEIVKYLVDHGADLNASSRNFQGNDFAQVFIGTPLDWAKKGGHQEVIQYLMSKGVRPAHL